jgi:hypothetical protein
MDDDIKSININITINQLEYDELMSAIEFAMAQINDTREILEPIRDKLVAEHGKPSWQNF